MYPLNAACFLRCVCKKQALKQTPHILRWGIEPHYPRMLLRGISAYAIVGIVATMVFRVTYASSPILSPVGFPGLSLA